MVNGTLTLIIAEPVIIGIMKIAVIGSGIGGLSAAWFLSQKHDVTIYEAHDRLGMGAHAVDIPLSPAVKNGDDGQELEYARVDVPMRVFFPEYYPTLMEIYRQAGVDVETLQYSASFSSVEGDLLFRYKNYQLTDRQIPFLYPQDLLKPSMVSLGVSVAHLLRQLSSEAVSHDMPADETLGSFLQRLDINKNVVQNFLLPAYAGICTCSYDNLLAYPAKLILSYINSGLIGTKMHRAKEGVDEVMSRLSAKVSSVRLGSPIRIVARVESGVEIETESGERERYDHVVIASQANQAVKMIDAIKPKEKEALTAFNYESFDVVIHSDQSLGPRKKSWWAPVNYLLQENSNAPMVTIPLNSVHKELATSAPVFQTWNPLIKPKAEHIHHQVKLFRPLMDSSALRGQDLIEQLHQEADRKIWFCGSYASPGIPLQESAARSAAMISEHIETQKTLTKASEPASTLRVS